MKKRHLIPKNLKFLMREYGLSARKLFEDLEFKSSLTSAKQLAAYVQGHNEPNIDIVNDLARYFKLTMEELCYKDFEQLQQNRGKIVGPASVDNPHI